MAASPPSLGERSIQNNKEADMPLTLTSLHTSIPDDLQEALARVYRDTPEFSDGNAAVASLARQLAQPGCTLHLGMFNAKPIAALMVSGPAEARRITHLCVHPANRRRGIARQILEAVAHSEAAAGGKELCLEWDGSQPGAQLLLLALEFRNVNGRQFRRQLQAS